MAINTLYDYYTGQGQSLPSLSARSQLYQQYGLGSSNTYGGTAEQNTALLGKLLSGSSSSSTVVPPTTVNPNQSAIDALTQQIASVKGQLGTAQTNYNAAITGGYTPTSGDVQYNTSGNVIPYSSTPAGALDTSGYAPNDYSKQLSDMIAQLQTQSTAYTDYLKGLPSATDTYTALNNQLGLPAATAGLTSTQTQIQNTENLIASLEKDIQSRSQGRLLTSAQQNRELAAEQKPLQTQLTTEQQLLGTQQAGVGNLQNQLVQMLSLAGQDYTRQQTIAQAPLNLTQSLLPTIESLSQYQSPADKLAYELAQKKLGLGTTPQTQVVEVNGRKLLIDSTTGKTIQDLGAVTTTNQNWTTDQIGSYIQKRIGEGAGWAVIAQELKDQNVPTYTGSTADKLLNTYFNPKTSTSTTNKNARLQELLDKSSGGTDLSKLTTDELAELTSLL